MKVDIRILVLRIVVIVIALLVIANGLAIFGVVSNIIIIIIAVLVFLIVMNEISLIVQVSDHKKIAALSSKQENTSEDQQCQ